MKPRKRPAPVPAPAPTDSVEGHNRLGILLTKGVRLLVPLKKRPRKILTSSVTLGILGIGVSYWLSDSSDSKNSGMHRQTTEQIDTRSQDIIDSLSRKALLLERQISEIRMLVIKTNMGIHKARTDSLFASALTAETAEEAERIYTEILAMAPCVEAYCNRAIIRREQGDRQGALDDYAEALELDPENAEIYRNRGMFHYLEYDLDAAERDQRRAIELAPDDVVAYRYLSYIYQDKGRPQEALRILNDPRIRESRDLFYLANRCTMNMLCGNYASAREDAQAMLKEEPRTPMAHCSLGDICFQTGDYRTAIVEYTRGIECMSAATPFSPCSLFPPLSNRSQAYNRIGLHDEALSDQFHLLSLFPDNPLIIKEIGISYFLKKEYGKALEYFDRAEKLDPGQNHLTERIIACVQTQSRDSALRYCRSLQETYPQAVQPLWWRALMHLHKGEEIEGMKLLRQALELDPEDTDAHMTVAVLLSNRHLFREAIAHYDKVVAIEPDYAKAYYQRGCCYVSLDDITRGYIDFTTAIQLNPSDPKPYRNRGCCFLASGERGQALRDLEKALELDSADADTYDALALYYRDCDAAKSLIYSYQAASLRKHNTSRNSGFGFSLIPTMDNLIKIGNRKILGRGQQTYTNRSISYK